MSLYFLTCHHFFKNLITSIPSIPFFPGIFRRNIHGVSKEKITRMLEHYQRFVSVPIIMSSSVPEKIEHFELCAYSCEERSSRYVKVPIYKN